MTIKQINWTKPIKAVGDGSGEFHLLPWTVGAGFRLGVFEYYPFAIHTYHESGEPASAGPRIENVLEEVSKTYALQANGSISPYQYTDGDDFTEIAKLRIVTSPGRKPRVDVLKPDGSEWEG